MSTTCATCGQAVASNAAFCIGCGRPVPQACSVCGASISATANWCGTCGAKVVGASAAPAVPTVPRAIAPILQPAPMPPAQPMPPAWGAPVTVAARPGGLLRAARRRPVLIAGAAVAMVAVLVATTVFGGRLPWNSPSIPLVETTMQAPTVIDVPTDDSTLSIVPGQENRLDTEGAALVIPAGAASPNTTVTVKVLQAPFHMTLGQPPQDGQAYASAVGPVVDFGPTGTTFNEPVTISVPYEHTFLPAGMSEDSIRPAYWNGQSWVVLPGVVDKDAHTVSVKLKDFKGTALVTYVVVGAAIVAGVGYTVNYAIQNWGELKWSDPVTKGTAKQYVTPGSATVKKYAAEAVITDAITHVQMPLNDPKMPDWLAAGNAQGHAMNLGYLDASTGKLLEIHHDEGKGSNWQKPDDFFTRGDALGPGNGDCTDSANSSVSVFIAAGFRAKAVFGYNEGDKDPKDAGHQHLWAEVFIGGKPYRMDEGGIYSPANWTHSNLPTYTPASGLDRHSTSMFDDQGQASYDEQWWKKAEVSVVATPASGTTYAFKASAWAIPNSAQQVEFLWDFGDGSKDTYDVHTPYAEPLVSDKTHELLQASTVTVVLYDITWKTSVELARATVTVLLAAPSPSPSASATGTHWVLISTTPNPAPAGKRTTSTRDKTWVTDSSDGKVSVTYDHLGVDGGVYHYDASTTWTPPPASAVPGDTWTTTLSARISCKLVFWIDGRPQYPQGEAHIGVGVSLGSQGEIYSDTSSDISMDLGPSEATAGCKGSGEDPAVGSQDTKLSWAFPDLTYSKNYSTRLDTLRISVYCESYTETTWSYLYEWKP